MKKSIRICFPFTLLIGIFFSVTPLHSQQSDSVKISQLASDLAELRNLLVEKDSLEYLETRKTLFDAFQNSQELHMTIGWRHDEIRNQQYSIRLLNVNNPGTAQMVKQFEEFMKRLVTEKFSSILNTDTLRKKKIFRTLENIFQNPIIAPILNSNPISSAISSAFNFISSLVEPKVEVVKSKLTDVVKDVKVDLNNIIDKSLLKELTADLVPYIQFFDTLYIINTQFSTRLSLLRQRSKTLVDSYKPVWDFYKGLGINTGQTASERLALFNQVYPLVAYNDDMSRYARNLREDKTRIGLQFSTRALSFNLKVNELTEDYNTAMREFRDQYISVLERYKDRLTLYSTTLQQAYAEFTTMKEDVAKLVTNNGTTPVNKPIDPAEQVVEKARWSYLTSDWDAKEKLEKIVSQ